METQKNQNGLAIASLVLGIVGLISSCIVIGVVPAIVGLVLGIVALAKKQNIGMSIAGIVCSVVAGMIFLFFMIIMLFGNETETINTDTEIKETVVQDFEKTEENNKISEKESQENNKKDEAESKESNTNKKNEETEEEFKAACKEYAYKEIARNPKNFVGEKIVLTVKVYQIMKGGLWGDEEYYRAYTNDEYGIWLGDEYIIYDERVNDDTKVLQDDILKVYGTIAGTTEVTRALTGVTEEIPAINMKYLELVDEDAYVEEDTYIEESQDSSATIGERNALREAKDYLDYTSFSRAGLIDQLEYEGYSYEESVYGVDNCGADWKEQALRCAKDYLVYSAFSKEGLEGQLEYEGFTSEETAYGVENCGADWKEQAAKMAQEYLDFMAFSREELIAQLEYEGFTSEEITYGITAVGY